MSEEKEVKVEKTPRKAYWCNTCNKRKYSATPCKCGSHSLRSRK